MSPDNFTAKNGIILPEYDEVITLKGVSVNGDNEYSASVIVQNNTSQELISTNYQGM